AMARRLDLNAPELPWHSARQRLLRIVSTLALAASALGKIAQDIVLLMQTEVAEVSEPHAGGSSSMPHKRNPVASTLTLAAVRRLHVEMASLLNNSLHEHERAAGAWHAEWQPLFDCLRLAAAAARHMRDATAGLIVNSEQMQHNLQATQGVTMAEAAKTLLAPHLGRTQAHQLVADACKRALAEARPLADILAADATVAEHTTGAALQAALAPANYTGSTQGFIDRALDDNQE